MSGFNKPVYVTSQGWQALKEELTHLSTVRRPNVVEQLQEAKGNGDWADQTEYFLIEEGLAFVDGRIQDLQYMLKHAQLIEPSNEDNVVDLGETVTIENEAGDREQYTIVGVAEANPAGGYISNESPLGAALLTHKVGDEVIVHIPMGEITYRIVKVS